MGFDLYILNDTRDLKSGWVIRPPSRGLVMKVLDELYEERTRKALNYEGNGRFYRDEVERVVRRFAEVIRAGVTLEWSGDAVVLEKDVAVLARLWDWLRQGREPEEYVYLG